MTPGPYNEDDLLPLSGLQHLAFCKRQWALIHIERVWAESDRTVQGRHLHERADDPFATEVRGDLVTARAVPLASRRLGLTGVADVVEFTRIAAPPAGQAIGLPGREGLWSPRPVEYKRGRPKSNDCDQVQVCAQALCLEEMLAVSIPAGDLFYAQTRRRCEVVFSPDLRRRVEELAERMQSLFQAGRTPPPIRSKACDRCSLADLCMPRLDRLSRSDGVARYLRRALDEQGD
jgi:CRISPR-associated exonuclease Cas4